MAVNKTVQGLLTPEGGRTTTGRDFVKLPHPSCLTILYIDITGGTASLDIEVSDDPTKPDPVKFFPLKSGVTVSGVHRISMPSSVVATNVTAVSGATVEVRYRILVLDNAPEYAIDTFQEGDIQARRIDVTGTLTTTEGTRKKLAQAQAAASATAIYTVPASTRAEIPHIRVVNPTASARTVSLWHDGSADVNMILPPVTLDAGHWAEFDGLIYMEAGDTLVADSDAATAVTITVYGKEFAE